MPRKPGPLEAVLTETPFKKVPISLVPAWVQTRYVYWKDLGELKHYLDERAFVFYGLWAKKELKRSNLTPEERKAKKKMYDRAYYQRKIKPARDLVKDQTQINLNSM